MFFLLPFHVDVPMRRLPWANWVLIGLTVLFYPLTVSSTGWTGLGEEMVLGRGSLGWVGHVFVHAGLWHLLGNVLFLWVFGNAVCAKVGNLAFPFLYLGIGACAGLTAYAIDPRPAVGASGAINGVVGAFVVWYLLNEISCWYLYWFFGAAGTGTFQVSSYWMILLWLAFDVWGAIRGGSNVGYAAHLAGFAVGFVLAILLLKFRRVEMEEGERSLLQVLGKEEPRPRRKVRVRQPIRRKS